MRPAQRIFLSYRRGDTAGHVGRLYDELVRQFGAARVFMDIDGIAPGEDFVQVLEARPREAAVVLVVMGPRWAGSTDTGARRIDQPGDFVRLEVAAALARRDVTLVPVLCDGATMPSDAALPDELKPLARRHAMTLSDLRWKHDFEQLVLAITPRLSAGPGGGGLARVPRAAWGVGGALLLLALWRPWQSPVRAGTTGAPSGGMPSPTMPKAIDRTLPSEVLRDAARQLKRARDGWATDAELVFLSVDCQAAWTGCQIIFTFRSSSSNGSLVAFRGADGGDWSYQQGQSMPTARPVPLDVLDLGDATRAARDAGLVGPVDRAVLEGPRPDFGRAAGRWVLEPADKAASGRTRFCVHATTGVVGDC